MSNSSRVPSESLVLLEDMKLTKLEKLVRYSWYPLKEAVAELDVPYEQVFSLTSGPILFYFSNGLVVGAASIPSLNSVALWVERDTKKGGGHGSIESDEELFPIDAESQLPHWSDIVGQKIKGFKIVEAQGRAKYPNLPNEVGLLIFMENGSEFILSHGLHDCSDDFSVITRGQVADELKLDLYDPNKSGMFIDCYFPES